METWPPTKFRLGLAKGDQLNQLLAEIRTRRDAGHVLRDGIEEEIASLQAASEDEQYSAALRLWKEVESTAVAGDFPYKEPSSLPEIRALRPPGTRIRDLELSDEELSSRIRGGWLGRCAGCLLGKPAERPWWTKQGIENFLTAHGAYPLSNYFPAVAEMPEGMEYYPSEVSNAENPCLLENITMMPRDDDIDYTILNLLLLEQLGPEFTSLNVGQMWLSKLPAAAVFGAARYAYRNLLLGLVPPETATHLNPHSEYIGAQIRADMFGYVCPGRPEKAAELAYKDAALDTLRNGIYGEMAVAAMIAAAFVESDPRRVIEAGLEEIPQSCRYAEAVRRCLEWHVQIPDWEEAVELALAEIKLNVAVNASLSFLGLLYGAGDFEKTICLAVMGGLDTDCNGATAGSIAGVMLGAGKIPAKWTSPLNDTIHSFIAGIGKGSVEDFAARTAAIAGQNIQGRPGA